MDTSLCCVYAVSLLFPSSEEQLKVEEAVLETIL